MKSSGPNTKPGWVPHPHCSREGQPDPGFQGPLGACPGIPAPGRGNMQERVKQGLHSLAGSGTFSRRRSLRVELSPGCLHSVWSS